MIFSDEEAKAAKEVAKTARIYEPSVRQLGEFFGRIVGRPIEQLGGLAGDVFANIRIEIALKWMNRIERIMKEQGLEKPSRNATINIVYPLLEAASLEEEDDIQELFAQLLVNAVNADSGITILKSFVFVIRTMSPLEAQILANLVDTPHEYLKDGRTVITSGLPNKYIHHIAEEQPPKPPEDIILALSNLVRNGCISPTSMFFGGSTLRTVSVTPFGFALLKACKPPA